jgi:BirA family transcriptional regulator, biotin operon repressor / biotin---[acetyl-CoA-carboxylase] ligase
MEDKKIGNQIYKVKSVDSTNNYAAKLLKQTKIPFGAVIMSYNQTDGKGQRNSNWESNSGENLLISVVLDMKNIPVSNIFYLSKSMALAVRACVSQITAADCMVKWPNDIIVRNQKVAGILIENQWRMQEISSSVVGIGLNVNQTSFSSDFNATSLCNITLNKYDLEEVLDVLCEKMELYYADFKNGEYSIIDKEYHEFLFNYNVWSSYSVEGEVFEAKNRGVVETGQLQLELKNGQLQLFELKEIKQLL